VRDAWFALIGVAAGATITGPWTLFAHNSAVAEAQRQSLLERLDRLIEALARVESAVQRFVAFGTLRTADPAGAESGRHLEEAGLAAGDIAVASLGAATIAQEVDGEGPLYSAVKAYVDAVQVVLRSKIPKSPREESPAQTAFVSARQKLEAELGAHLARIRQAEIGFQARATGRFRPPLRAPVVRQ
jgi:hypothetical protein